MPNKSRSMDFFQPVRSTDPLVGRPKPKIQSVSAPIATQRPTRSASAPLISRATQPQMRRASNQSSSVFVKKTVVSQKKPASATASVTTTVTSVAKTAQTVNRQVAQPQPRPHTPAPVPEKKSEGKVTYPFGGEPPFLKSVKVEKRPLSNSVPPKDFSASPEFGKKKPRRPDPVRIKSKSKKKQNALSLALIIIITIILGAAAGVGVFFLIAR